MNYSNQPVTELIRGPLLHTPQGWVVVATVGVYTLLALLFGVLDLTPPLGKTVDTFVTICLFWPFIVFLVFAKDGLASSFDPSWCQAAFLMICAVMPMLYVVWSWLATHFL